MERTNKAKTRYIAQLGLFIGIILLMELAGLTKIPIGPGLNMTFSMIPIAVGAMLLGPLAGTILGGVYGLTSLYNAMTGTGGMTFMLFGISPILTILLCVGTRILVGAVTGWIFKGLKKLDRHNIWCYFAGGLAAPLLNTIFFMGFLVLAFYNTDYVQELAAGKGATNPLNFIILFVGVQGLIEAATGLVIGGTVAKGVAHALKLDR
ncbi:MAG: ECF transporter S component [Clostridia bacterium]|nr:ECF transporter S component [Clostridia bacterium]